MSEQKKKTHILLVEDDESIRYMLETKLFKSGYTVSVAANGLHALQVIQSKKNIDLILCDLKMPGKDGLEFLKAMKALKFSAPMVILTGYPEKGKIIQAIREGVRDVLLKPIKHQELMDKIKIYINDGDNDNIDENIQNVA